MDARQRLVGRGAKRLVQVVMRDRIEWPTLALLTGCYAVWAACLFWLAPLSLLLAIFLAGICIALHSSIQHEVIHGHPTPRPLLNAMLVFPALTLVVPYLRFRDSHLAHHRDATLTDPYDDPETNYLDPALWHRMPRPARWLMAINNTLAGRLLLGPVIGQVTWMGCDLRAIARGDRRALAGWLLHLPSVALVLGLLAPAPMPLWAYLVAAYLGLALLKIRTFLEHQAHAKSRARTVIIEDRGPLSLLFLNNNLHVVHHMHPRVPWYRLPLLYGRNPERYLAVNEGYRYRSYAEVFRAHFLRAKDPVPHPLWRP